MSEADQISPGVEPPSNIDQHEPTPPGGAAGCGNYPKAEGSAILSAPEVRSQEAGEDQVASLAPPLPPIIDVFDMDWIKIRQAGDPASVRARMRGIVEETEVLLDRVGGPGMLFDSDRLNSSDRAIGVSSSFGAPLWFIGDLHGDLLALESALALIDNEWLKTNGDRPRIVFLGDLFDDEGFGLETILRVFELIMVAPERVCVITGNHEEALSYDGVRFASNVEPADFAEFLNANLSHEWIERAGKLAVRVFARAPCALFFSDGLLVAHGGFPLTDLHPQLLASENWNDPACLSDFVWTRAHPTARKKIPNRYSRGSQFGYEDFEAFCNVSKALNRPVTHMVRGHDHVEDRYAMYPAYQRRPVLTTVALARRLRRERFGSYERVPTVARFVEGSVPQVYRLHIPAAIVRDVYPEPIEKAEDEEASR